MRRTKRGKGGGQVSPEDERPLEPDKFRQLMRRQASTVVIVTVAGKRPTGFTATSFTSVSLNPPLVLFCLDRSSSSWPAVARARHLSIHLLADGQEDIARTFATSGIDRFADSTWSPDEDGIPSIKGVLARLTCRVVERTAAGDHSIVLAEPVRASTATPPGADRSSTTTAVTRRLASGDDLADSG
ncbi:flavin reductase family protein [Nonomuraea lactucae]|uniref:flavin reductase family protein n=1 Tax=Nonomuraea lactucae TaxID=2249762 RepID=UPI001F05A9ED|nr:flavin reductase family protein [Nonomuraea lactucae]